MHFIMNGHGIQGRIGSVARRYLSNDVWCGFAFLQESIHGAPPMFGGRQRPTAEEYSVLLLTTGFFSTANCSKSDNDHTLQMV